MASAAISAVPAASDEPLSKEECWKMAQDIKSTETHSVWWLHGAARDKNTPAIALAISIAPAIAVASAFP